MTQPADSHPGKVLLLIEPDAAIRRSMLDWLRAAVPECCAIGATSIEAATALPQFESPAIVVVDIANPDADGAGTIRNIKRITRYARVIALTMSDHTGYCESLACAGASASLPIWETDCQLVPLIREILTAGRK
jgi:DNA-binding NarL/FixJ family response regulator